MIFLTVASAFFVSIAVLINGQMAKNQARDSINQLESFVRGSLNDVNNGYYPELATQGVNCIVAGGVVTSYTIAGANNRGTSQTCVLIGKSITFRANSLEIGTWIAPKNIASVASKTPMKEIVELRDNKPYRWGMTKQIADETYYVLNTNFGADAAASASDFVSGAQSVSVYVEQPAGSNTLVPANNKTVCFSKAGTNAFASLVLAEDYALKVRTDYNGAGC